MTIGILRDCILGRRRSFQRDARAFLKHLHPPLQLLGKEHIPQSGPCVLTFNHYSRPGFRAWWLAWAIASVVPKEAHWIVTREWTFPGKWYAPLGIRLSRLVLRRLALTYGFTLMPAMPPRPEDTQARARAVRKVLALTHDTPDLILAFAPEGRDSPDGRLLWPPPGAGRFLALLAGAGLSIVPVGLYEARGMLWLHFGRPYTLPIPAELPAGERDRRAAHIAMSHIAALLPPHLRGDFA